MSFFSRAGSLGLLLVLAGCAEPNGVSCELNSDCLQGTCQEGKCVRECADSELDCPIGYYCSDVGRCEYQGDGGSGSTSTTSGSGGASSTSTSTGDVTSTSTTTSTTSTSTSTSTGSGMGLADLTLCAADGDCDSGMCRAMTPNGQKRCTHACTSSSQCPSGLRCEDPGTGLACVFSDVGKACTGAGQCNYACLSPVNYCVSQCQSGADCPNGYGCMLAAGQKVCIKVEADCAADTSQCVVPAACDSSPNLVVSSCTIACDSSADCPQRAIGLPAWTCDAGGICRRPSDVYGPLPGGFAPAQWACNAQSNVVNVCNDGLHIDFANFTQPSPPPVSCSSSMTTDGLAGDACLDSCRYQGGCASGFACAAVAELSPGQRIGLCMPRGGGEVGDACSQNGNCVFGLCDSNQCSRDCTRDGVCPEGSTCTTMAGSTAEGLPYKTCQ